MIRKFSLVNEYGTKFVLNNVHKGYLQNPSGLGMSKEYAYTRLGNAWANNYLRFSQGTITGEIVFAGHPYTAITEILEYLRTSNELKLFYETDAGEYYKEVDLVQWSKTEITDGGILTCPVTFMPKSLWLQENSYKITVESAGSSTGKAYTVDDNAYQYDYTYNEYVGGEVQIVNSGSVPASFMVTFNGSITNPKIQLFVNGTETAKAEIVGSALQGESIRYSSKDGNLYCYLHGQNNDVNLVNGMGISNDNFFKVPIGNSVLKISASSEITSTVEITVNTEYGVV